MSVKSSIEQATKAVMGALIPGEGEPDILDTLQTEHDEVQDLLDRLTRAKRPENRRVC